MFDLDEVLLGVLPEDAQRRLPPIPLALQQVAFSAVAVDSREATPGSLFVALRGERADGHDFLAAAVARGARGALVRREQVAGRTLDRPSTLVDPISGEGLADATSDTVFLIAVDDPLSALQQLGGLPSWIVHADGAWNHRQRGQDLH